MKSTTDQRPFLLVYGKHLPILAVLLCALSCGTDSSKTSPKQGRLVFQDDFDRQELGSDWLDTTMEDTNTKPGNTTTGRYRIVNGELRAEGARNNPLWLTKKLPPNSRVEFTARSTSKAVDIKVEVYGDGRSKPTSLSYTATSYVIILGGWNNTKSIIARMDEHKRDRKVRTAPKAAPNRSYRFSIERIGNRLSWLLDRKPFLEMNDPHPLLGMGHEYFAFNNWSSEVFFDNLSIYEI